MSYTATCAIQDWSYSASQRGTKKDQPQNCLQQQRSYEKDRNSHHEASWHSQRDTIQTTATRTLPNHFVRLKSSRRHAVFRHTRPEWAAAGLVSPLILSLERFICSSLGWIGWLSRTECFGWPGFSALPERNDSNRWTVSLRPAADTRRGRIDVISLPLLVPSKTFSSSAR